MFAVSGRAVAAAADSGPGVTFAIVCITWKHKNIPYFLVGPETLPKRLSVCARCLQGQQADSPLNPRKNQMCVHDTGPKDIGMFAVTGRAILAAAVSGAAFAFAIAHITLKHKNIPYFLVGPESLPKRLSMCPRCLQGQQD
jgi:hypothetical protein